MTTRLDVRAAELRTPHPQGGRAPRFLVARITAQPAGPAAPRAERPPLNLALVIDASGSMAGDKLAAAKRAAAGVVDRLGPRDRLTIVSFASEVQVHLDGAVMAPGTAATAHAAIAALVARDMTNLSEGWFTGVECAEAAGLAGGGVPRVIILSDGHANQGITDHASLAHHAAELARRGVITSTLGIGDGYDEVLLGAIAEAGGGRLHDAELAEEIELVLLGELGEAAGAVAERLELAIDAPPGLALVPLGRGRREPLPPAHWLPLGALARDGERSLVLRIERAGPPLAPGAAAPGLDIRVRGLCPATGAPLDAHGRHQPGVADATATPDVELRRLVAGAWRADLLALMGRAHRAGDIARARQLVDAELPAFRALVAGLAEAAGWCEELEILRNQLDHAWSPRLAKEVDYMAAVGARQGRDYRGPAKESLAERVRRERRA